MACESCGDTPKKKRPGFTRAVIEIDNPENIVLLRKVTIPASMGDETDVPPVVGKYRNVILQYEANKNTYFYSSDGIPAKIEVSQEVIDRIKALEDDLETEVTDRQEADANLQTQIDTIIASSDVKDIVGTHEDLEDYDTSTLGDNDIIKVLSDETQADQTTYYRWSTATSSFTLIGAVGPFYTKSQTDELLAGKQGTLTAGSNIQIADDNTISATDTTYTAGTGLSLSGAEFSVDTETIATQSDLTTGLATKADTSSLATVATSGSYNDLLNKPTIPAAQIQSDWDQTTTTALDYIKNKPSLATVATSGNYGDLVNKPNLATVATSGSYNDLINKPTIPTVNDNTLTIKKNGTNVATFTANSSTDVSADISVPTAVTDLSDASDYALTSSLATVATSGSYNDLSDKPNLATVATSGSYNDLTNKPTIPTVNDATLTIQKNNTTVDTFTANASTDKTINITVPTSASDVSALPSSTKYGATISMTIDDEYTAVQNPSGNPQAQGWYEKEEGVQTRGSTPDPTHAPETDTYFLTEDTTVQSGKTYYTGPTYIITTILRDQDGNTLGSAQTIDLPLESVVVSGSYDSANKKVVLTLKDGSTVDFSVADLVSGLQTELSATNKLNADYVDDTNSTNKFVTASEKSVWSGKQDELTAGDGITIADEGGALVISADRTQPYSYSNMITYTTTNDRNEHDLQTYTVTEAGLYLIFCDGWIYENWATLTTNVYPCVRIKKNGTEVCKTQEQILNDGDATEQRDMDVQCLLSLSVGDVVKIVFQQNNSSAADMEFEYSWGIVKVSN